MVTQNPRLRAAIKTYETRPRPGSEVAAPRRAREWMVDNVLMLPCPRSPHNAFPFTRFLFPRPVSPLPHLLRNRARASHAAIREFAFGGALRAAFCFPQRSSQSLRKAESAISHRPSASVRQRRTTRRQYARRTWIPTEGGQQSDDCGQPMGGLNGVPVDNRID